MVPLTPEQHIERAEEALESRDPVAIHRAGLHVALAEYKKKYPPENGRPVRSSGRMHDHIQRRRCTTECPAHNTDSNNYPRPIQDNPQA